MLGRSGGFMSLGGQTVRQTCGMQPAYRLRHTCGSSCTDFPRLMGLGVWRFREGFRGLGLRGSGV